ncbi:phospholipase [Curtobacterium sp. 'Ferrero']|uniref:aggregation-promoting factor C-terminal-like domain-containing protein n=1 Tax=Curtobacterium sp. 'Ferrero' TaxID=2033654 RepID=UPI0020D0F822|nr:phospholipase [Curtobacterium sp. 'Ferrero']
MTRRTTPSPTSTSSSVTTAVPATATTRREALDSRSRRVRRALRRRTTLIASGAAVLAIAGGGVAVGTQPALGEALGVPSASPTSSPALSGTALDRAQAQATISTADNVLAHANDKVDTRALEQRIEALGDFRKLSGGALTTRIASTVSASTEVAEASAAQDKSDADAAAAAAAKAAAEKAAAAKAAAAAAEAARKLAAGNTVAGAKATASSLAASQYGWGSGQFQCLDSLWTKESGWNYQAVNSNGGATGIPQALPGSKMATMGSDWQTNATTQIKWGLQYIADAYGTPCAAWGHSQASNFY